MTDPSRYPDAGGVPRWAKLLGLVVLVVALLVVVMLLIGGGHGPRRHGGACLEPSDAVSRQAP